MKTIIKRSMVEQPYFPEKITKAMAKAFESVGEFFGDEKIKGLLMQVEEKFADRDKAEVEEIQDVVEQVIMENGCYNAAKSYILYREKERKCEKSGKIWLQRSETRSLQKLLQIYRTVMRVTI